MITVVNLGQTSGLVTQSPAQLKQHFVVLSGELAGLTAAQPLLKKGCTVYADRQSLRVGKLAHTSEQEKFRFDIG